MSQPGFHPDAKIEMREAAGCYDDQRPGLGRSSSMWPNLRERGALDDRAAYDAVLAKVRDTEPDADDEL